jgi:hypothetical protein
MSARVTRSEACFVLSEAVPRAFRAQELRNPGLASPAAAATTWTAKIGSSYGSATVVIGTSTRLGIAAKGFGAKTAYTVSIRRGTCSTPGALVLSRKVITSAYGRITQSFALTTTQARLVKLPMSIRVGTRCGTFKGAATPTPVPVAGSTRSNPIPLGQIGRVGDWAITVTNVYPDAWSMIQAANMFNDPPAAGKQFFMIAVAATYTGAGSAHLDSGYSMRAVGSLNVGYTTFDNSCGVLPDPNLKSDDPDAFSGGTVSGNAACWEIVSSDASSLVMYFQPFLTGTTTWFALH